MNIVCFSILKEGRGLIFILAPHFWVSHRLIFPRVVGPFADYHNFRSTFSSLLLEDCNLYNNLSYYIRMMEYRVGRLSSAYSAEELVDVVWRPKSCFTLLSINRYTACVSPSLWVHNVAPQIAREITVARKKVNLERVLSRLDISILVY